MQDDTVRLLNECHFGARMAVTAIDTVLQSVQDPELRGRLQCSRSDHEVLVQETGRILEKSGRDARDPSPMLRKMAQARTSVRMRLHPTDSTAAVLLKQWLPHGHPAAGQAAQPPALRRRPVPGRRPPPHRHRGRSHGQYAPLPLSRAGPAFPPAAAAPLHRLPPLPPFAARRIWPRSGLDFPTNPVYNRGNNGSEESRL